MILRLPILPIILLVLSSSCQSKEELDLRKSSANTADINSEQNRGSQDMTTKDSELIEADDDSADQTSKFPASDYILYLKPESFVDGVLTGYAYVDSDNKVQPEVEFYVGGSKDQGGTYVGKTIANIEGPNDGLGEGDHDFDFIVPPEFFTEGQPYLIQAYIVGVDEVSSSMRQYTGHIPRGKDLFDASQALLNSCRGCHVPSYGFGLSFMREGASGTNNTLYQNVSGQAHAGGNHCSQVAGLCAFVEQWFELEFGGT